MIISHNVTTTACNSITYGTSTVTLKRQARANIQFYYSEGVHATKKSKRALSIIITYTSIIYDTRY